ncbi:MAG: hypothetical protein AAEI92_08760 [Arenicellales bacterium]
MKRRFELQTLDQRGIYIYYTEGANVVKDMPTAFFAPGPLVTF